MPPHLGLTHLDEAVASPFVRLAELLRDSEPGRTPIDLSIVHPRAVLPPFLGPILEQNLAAFGRYPPIRGLPDLVAGIADWIGRRYPTLAGKIDPERLEFFTVRKGVMLHAIAKPRRKRISFPV